MNIFTIVKSLFLTKRERIERKCEKIGHDWYRPNPVWESCRQCNNYRYRPINEYADPQQLLNR